MDYSFLINTGLFTGCDEKQVESMLTCLAAYTKSYEKGEVIYHVGEKVSSLGLVLSGAVNIENDDIWGNKSILSRIVAGGIFAETYATISSPLMVNVIACETTTVLFLNSSGILTTCSNSCPQHNLVIKNLLQITANKNLALSSRILHTSSKSIRGRLMSYFSHQVLQKGTYEFSIPFNRQELADYLGVDRSALSNELSKMRSDGILTYEKNRFFLKENI